MPPPQVFLSLLIASTLMGVPPSPPAICGPSTLYAPSPAAPKPGSLYPRAIQLKHAGRQNGFMLATFEEYSKETPSFPIYRSTNGGAAWSLFSRVRDTESGWGMRFQPFLYELPNALGPMPAGTILCLGNSIPADMSHTRLDVYKSLDHGETWSFVSHIAAGGAANPDGRQDPVWEPFALFSNHKLIVYYSDERDPKHNQKIVHQTSRDGVHWSEVVNDVALASPLRPGMPVVAKMGNGKYLMSWECVCDRNTFTSVKVTADPESWDASDGGTKIAGSGGTPYTVWLHDGRRNGMLVQSSNGRDNLFVNTDYGAPGSAWTQVPGKVRAGYSRALVVLSGHKSLFEISPVRAANGYNNIQYGSLILSVPANDKDDVAPCVPCALYAGVLCAATSIMACANSRGASCGRL